MTIERRDSKCAGPAPRRTKVSCMATPLREIVDLYDSSLPLARASTIPASWYTDPRIETLERQTVLARSWQVVARTDQHGDLALRVRGFEVHDHL